MSIIFINIFKNITDSRIERKKLYPLTEILLVAFATILGGGETYTDMEDFGNAKLETLKELSDFKNGIPSEDTFARVLELINPKEFQKVFMEWVATLMQQNETIIAIDGKTVRRSGSPTNKTKPLHLLHAWAANNRLTLGFQKVDEKSNEIKAIPEILKLLSLKGATVTIDAMGCQTAIAQQIVDQGGNFLLSLKGNQGNLHKDIKFFFESDQNDKNIIKFTTESKKGHGRIEKRTYGLYTKINTFKQLHPQWSMLESIGFVSLKRIIGTKTTEETRYYISTLTDAQKFAEASRKHWGVENSLHWVLDVVFHEDDCRIRAKNAVENIAIIRRAALNLITLDTVSKRSKRLKRLKAGWDDEYLKKVLTQQF